ncbi:unnamed protein product [Urochloa decumbens]|uniref:F-box domain-containing protein n=1 Tax=Urochloa decumbens TaxID=240449 RepID=A0ABC9FRW8_9POAL
MTLEKDVPDHLLVLVIRRLDSHISFLRAAAVCRRWRRVVYNALTRPGFIYPGPHLFGHYHVPDPSYSPAAGRRSTLFIPAPRSTVNSGRFSLDFLPRGRRPWELVDGRGTILLLANKRRGGHFPDLVVCEPLTRRYRRINPDEDAKYHRCLGAFIAKKNISTTCMSDFTVICVTYDRSDGMAQDVGPLTVRLYSDRYGRGWGWHDKVSSYNDYINGAESAIYAGRSAGLVCWSIDDQGTVLAARTNGGIFTRFRVPEEARGQQNRCKFRFVDEVREAVYPEIVRLACLIGDELRVYVEEAQGHTRNWVLKCKLCLPEATLGLPGRKACYFGLSAKIVTAGDGYIVLTPAEETWLFSVELKTMRVEREHSRNRIAGEVYTYELQTSPNVHACVVKCKRESHGPFRRGVGPCSHICVCD